MRRAPPAWMTIIETLWATTSCISRAIRRRSSATAASASASRCSCSRTAASCSSAVRRLRLRTARPASQNIVANAPGKKMSPQTNASASSATTAIEATANTQPGDRRAALGVRADGPREEDQAEEQRVELRRLGEEGRHQQRDRAPDADRHQRMAAAQERRRGDEDDQGEVDDQRAAEVVDRRDLDDAADAQHEGEQPVPVARVHAPQASHDNVSSAGPGATSARPIGSRAATRQPSGPAGGRLDLAAVHRRRARAGRAAGARRAPRRRRSPRADRTRRTRASRRRGPPPRRERGGASPARAGRR